MTINEVALARLAGRVVGLTRTEVGLRVAESRFPHLAPNDLRSEARAANASQYRRIVEEPRLPGEEKETGEAVVASLLKLIRTS